MDTKLPKDSDANYDESREEAKHPGALLGLIMGIYPAILVIGLLLVVSIVGVRSMFPSTYPPPTMPENETVQQAVQSSSDSTPEKGTTLTSSLENNK